MSSIRSSSRQAPPTTRAKTSRGTGFTDANITASTRPIQVAAVRGHGPGSGSGSRDRAPMTRDNIAPRSGRSAAKFGAEPIKRLAGEPGRPAGDVSNESMQASSRPWVDGSPSPRPGQVMSIAERGRVLAQTQVTPRRGCGRQGLPHPPGAEPGRFSPDHLVERQKSGAGLEGDSRRSRPGGSGSVCRSAVNG